MRDEDGPFHPFGKFRAGPSAFILCLADGTRLVLQAGDEDAARIVNFFARAAQLSPAPHPLSPHTRCLLTVTARNGSDHQVFECDTANEADAVCVLAQPDAPRRRRKRDFIKAGTPGRARRSKPEPLPEEQWFWQQLARLSAAIARETQPRGGVLLHSGLAAHPDLSGLSRRTSDNLTGLRGILLAGRSGVGKSTACRRLPLPWRALADDVTLVVRDSAARGADAFLAHPWPTWSCFFGDKAGDGSDHWEIQEAAPLRAIVVMEQGNEDRIEPLGPGHALALLTELARQASEHLVQAIPKDEVPAFHCQSFDNLSALVRAVPAYLLHVSLDGAFWEEIEQVLKD
ncbi:MAG: SynChlorMet cassette protein ScmC [Anaerolineae bacterium]